MTEAADWIAVDWGTSNLRAWAMGADGAPMAEASSGAGMNTLARDGFEPALLDLVGPWLALDGPTTIVACGMVGARQGWIEAPYVATPCAPLHAEAMVRAPAADPRLSVHIIPGVSQASPPDVMRGEETQIAGFIAARPRFDGVLCLPGTHTKWVHVSAGEIVSFATFMTGEVFGLLANSSVLRHSVGSDEWSDADFAEAVEDAMARPEKFAVAPLRPARGLAAGEPAPGACPRAALGAADRSGAGRVEALLAGPRGGADRRRRAGADIPLGSRALRPAGRAAGRQGHDPRRSGRRAAPSSGPTAASSLKHGRRRAENKSALRKTAGGRSAREVGRDGAISEPIPFTAISGSSAREDRRRRPLSWSSRS